MVIGAFIAVDFFTGNGMCQYVISNWGIRIWGALLGLVILLLLGFISHHRSFTHSFVGMASFGIAMYFFCRPAAFPFALGYLSHIIADLFNKRGLQLFFPFRWRLCLKLCYSNKTVNRILFWAAFLTDLILGAFLFWTAIVKSGGTFAFISLLSEKNLFGLNMLQIYLILINIATLCGVQRSWTLREREVLAETDEQIRIGYEFEIWLLNILCLSGGGVGMLAVLILHRAFPVEYNGVWWSFCCTSILFWSTVYCYICDPFNWHIQDIHWLSSAHIPMVVYILVINIIGALVIYSLRKKKLFDDSIWHTLIWLIGTSGGALGTILMVLCTRRENRFFYVKVGFPIMLISQVVFCLYMMSAGIF